MEFKQIGVIGAGTMGNGIAQVFAQAGFSVVMADVSDAAVARGLASIGSSLARLVKKGAQTEAGAGEVLARIQGRTGLVTLGDCQLVIEAATENATIKEQIFRELAGIVGPDTILASNTSSISLTTIAAWVPQPQRVIGMHFMNPVPLMQLVEIIRALQTNDATHAAIHALSLQLGKTPVTVKDGPGFVSNRVLMPMINEAAFVLYENLATAEDIDTVMKLGMNHPIGPLALADLIGLDTCLSIMDILHREFRDSKYRACPLLVQLVAAGHLGRKSGKGFYAY